MKLQFEDLISRKERSKDISYSFKMDEIYFDGDKIKPLEEIVVEGKVTSDKDIIVIKANIKGKLELTCSRCLDTFIYPIDIDIEEKFTKDKELEESDDVNFVNGDVLDITELVENIIISTLPIKRLCSDDCKGLCQVCGTNLNKSTCNCNNSDVDIRMAGLSALFDNKEV